MTTNDSNFQVSGNLTALETVNSKYQALGISSNNYNLTNIATPANITGSQTYSNSIPYAPGLANTSTNSNFLYLIFDSNATASWTCNIVVESQTNTNVTQSNFAINKPSSSTTYLLTYGPATTTSTTVLPFVTLTLNGASNYISFTQPGGTGSDGNVTYSLSYNFISSNTLSIAVPYFSTSS